MNLVLHLDAKHKRTIEDLFLMSASGVGAPAEDAAAIFRIAKDMNFHVSVSSDDVLRLLRFVGWLLSYDTSSGRTVSLKSLFASVVMQAQAQDSYFETRLREFGVCRHIEKLEGARVNVARTHKTRQVMIRMAGAEVMSSTTESSWSASGVREGK